MAREQQQAPPPQEHPHDPTPALDFAIIAAIALVLLSALPLQSLLRRLAVLLAPLGIPWEALVGVVGVTGPAGFTVPAPQAPAGTAERAVERGIAARRAMYVLAAARRIAHGGSIAAERRLWGAHQQAERRRRQAARRVDQAARKHGPLLGWYSRLDERTTAVCRAAHGRNFDARRPPGIGYPGTLHAGNCRCRPGPPHPGGERLP